MPSYTKQRSNPHGRQRINNKRGERRGNPRGPKKAYIHPSKFIKAAKSIAEDVYVPQHSFQDFIFDENIKSNLQNMGYKTPSPVQDKAIPHGLAGDDIVGIANTGTGKTAAFAIPLLHRLITEPASKAIIIAPTRELAEQIEQQCRVIARGSRLNGALLIGGASIGLQLRDLSYKPRIIVGTPGRIKDHLERGSLKLNDCNLVVLDEVDRMLDMGFVHDITNILDCTSKERQSFYFSATVDNRVRSIIEKFSNNPVYISVKSGDTSDNVNQDIVVHENSDKLDKLHEILIKKTTAKTIIFDDTHNTVERLTKALTERGFNADAIHGGKSQSQRQRVLRKFKTNEVKILVATDVAARGLDMSDITHVINFSLPNSYEDYVHRIGRTGRAGKVGYALTFVEK